MARIRRKALNTRVLGALVALNVHGLVAGTPTGAAFFATMSSDAWVNV
jgi:hypothetical protein